jgi:hypothetical protein
MREKQATTLNGATGERTFTTCAGCAGAYRHLSVQHVEVLLVSQDSLGPVRADALCRLQSPPSS